MIYHILGKSNNMISLLIDALYWRRDLKIEVVQNIEVDDNPPFHMGTDTLVMDSNNWDGIYNNLLLGVIRVPTKKTVYGYFLSEHNIIEDDYTRLVHPDASISVQTEIGHGVFISSGCVVAPYVSIDNLVTLNRGVMVGHHTKIGKFSTLNPGCNIAGGSTIGEYTTIGMGANIFDGVNIGSNTVIGAGSLVTEDIPDNVVAYGIPAKVVREI